MCDGQSVLPLTLLPPRPTRRPWLLKRGPPIRTGRLHRQIRRAFIASNDAPSAAGGLRFDLGILELKSPGICAGAQKEPSYDRPPCLGGGRQEHLTVWRESKEAIFLFASLLKFRCNISGM